MRRLLTALALSLIAVTLLACGGRVNVNPGPGGNKRTPDGGKDVPGDPKEKTAVDAIKSHQGSVKQEGGNVIEVHLFQDSVNDNVLKELTALSKVQKMKLTHAKITANGIRHLTSLKSLTELDLWGCQVNDAGAKEIAKMTQLKSLNMAGCKVTPAGFRDLAPLTQLENLEIFGSEFVDAKAVAAVVATLPQLKRLSVNNCSIYDEGAMEIGKLANLRYLSAYGTRVKDKGLAALPNIRTLEELELSFDFTDESAKIISNCKALHTLKLFNNRDLTDKGLEFLSTLPNLKMLELRGGAVTQKGVEAFKKVRPACEFKHS